MSENQRIVGLDAARAIMMLLGVLLHALVFSIFFIEINSVSEFHVIMGTFFTIHTFRMPAFFLLAGYFSNMILETRGSDGYLKNRGKRLGLVFLIFAPTIAPLTYLASDSTQPLGLQHLWFLYYLLIVSGVFYLSTFLKMPEWLGNFQRKFGSWISSPALLWLAPLILTPIPGLLDESARIKTSESLIPNLTLLAFYGLFFALGITLHKSGRVGLDALARRAPILLVVGFLAAQVAFGWGVDDGLDVAKIPAALVASFYLSLGVIGIFVRLIKQENRVWTYLRKTSYWVYLVHLPIVFVVLRLAGALNLTSLIAIPSAFLFAFGFSLVTYEFLVKRTALVRIV